jgi:uncharacterized membrane protein
MIRQMRMAWSNRGDASFMWRGEEVTRLEGFSDAVFGFALTLLVVSIEVPRTFDQLAQTMRGFLGFAFSFAILLGVWEKHYRFFRRYGLQDGWTVILNSFVLFVVVFYVYPLKFMASMLLGGLFDDSAAASIRTDQVASLMAIYGSGFAAIFALYAILYVHAYRQRVHLSLSPLEVALTRNEILRNILMCVLGLGSVVMAELLSANRSGAAGYAYFLIGPIESWHGATAGRLRRRYTSEPPVPRDEPTPGAG